jgi:hypothetical protein
MNVAKFALVILCLAAFFESDAFRAKARHYHSTFDRLFDQYGLIRWNDEKARLDNFAIQITNDPDLIGYIFVSDGENVCAGEAQARVVRAKKYVVEHRGVPWNRVIWKHDGYTGEFRITLQPVSRTIQIPYPFMGIVEEKPEKHLTKGCRSRIERIKSSKW